MSVVHDTVNWVDDPRQLIGEHHLLGRRPSYHSRTDDPVWEKWENRSRKLCRNENRNLPLTCGLDKHL